jgi:beta-glucosidase
MKKWFLLFLITVSLFAQTRLKHFNTSLPLEERIDYLISRMTLAEKISQMKFDAPAIDRLGIPEYNWWNECLHGVARNGLATVFPQAIGLAAMWDKDLMFKVASVISDEARAKYHDALKHNQHGIYQGLTFWSPNINVFRDPRWGRGMETYGEDPYLTGQLAVQFVKGLQGNDPKYFKSIATVKHFAVHSGPEPERHTFNAEVSDYDLQETYLAAFKTSVQEANVQSIMCAYNSLRNKACCSNDPLLENMLRNEWGFKGYVVSDCWAISDIYKFHKEAQDAASASAVAVKAGTDLECGDSYPALFEAVQKGLIKEDDLNKSLKRLFEARFKLGMFDPDDSVPFTKIPYSVLNSKANRAVAFEAAQKSIVLLKNAKNILPLSKKLNSIAVIGPNANDEEVLLGNYNGTPSDPITPLQGIKRKVGANTKIIYERGCDLAENMNSFDAIPAKYLFISQDKKVNGLNAEYFEKLDFKGESKKRIDKEVDFKWLQKQLNTSSNSEKSIKWSGYLVPPKSGLYKIGGYGFNGFNISVDDSELVKYFHIHHPQYVFKEISLEAGKSYKIQIDFYASSAYSQMKLFWSMPDDNKEERALAAAKKCDAVIMFMGLSSRLEGEEMKVPVPGFAGGDRLTLDLPATQENLIKKIAALGKPVILVLLNGSALSVNWEEENIPAIVESWYGGQATGDAIADVLFGNYNPSGRLPVTFYKSVKQLPEFNNYNMKGRTYRYFDGDVLFPFGYGLSYTTFSYGNIRLSKDRVKPGEKVKLQVDVKNTGRATGEEVVQLYVKGKGLNHNDAIKSLKGFERVSLKPSQKKTVEFEISGKTLEVFKPGEGFVVEKGDYFILVGTSSNEVNLKEIKITIQ